MLRLYFLLGCCHLIKVLSFQSVSNSGKLFCHFLFGRVVSNGEKKIDDTLIKARTLNKHKADTGWETLFFLSCIWNMHLSHYRNRGCSRVKLTEPKVNRRVIQFTFSFFHLSLMPQALFVLPVFLRYPISQTLVRLSHPTNETNTFSLILSSGANNLGRCCCAVSQ